jgi:hypothetical protein|tara:strand:- start:2921 stop:4201 length:1281 start_codon:yes stop_codon:yes gene_type:complete
MKSFLILLFTFCLFSELLYAEKTDVVYAGFALSAEFSDLNTVVKYTNKIIEKAKSDGTQNIIDKSLIEVTKKLDLNHINLSYDLITEETSKIAMSVFLDQEILEEFHLPPQDCKKINLNECYIYRINNQYQIIFFDFKQMTFIKAVPFEGIYISPPSSKLDEEGKIKLFEESYKNGNWLLPPAADQEKKSKFTDRIYSLVLPKTEVKTFYENYLGVNPSEDGFKINIDKISALTPSHILDNVHLLKRQVANYFLAEIALQHNVPIVPYYEGVGVGGTLKAKYANRNEVFNLKIPEPTYYVDFLIRGFIKKEFKKDANVENLTWWIYGSGINLRIYEPLLNKEFLNIAMTKANYKKIPDIMKLNSENEFVNIYQLTLKPLSEEFGGIIGSDFKSKKDKEWIKKVAKNQIKPDDMKKLHKLFTRLSAD